MFVSWETSEASLSFLLFFSFQLFREVRIMKGLNHPNIGKTFVPYYVCVHSLTCLLLSAGVCVWAKTKSVVFNGHNRGQMEVWLLTVEMWHESNMASHHDCFVIKHTSRILCSSSCFFFYPLLFCSETVWGDWDRQDPLPGHGICQWRWVQKSNQIRLYL